MRFIGLLVDKFICWAYGLMKLVSYEVYRLISLSDVLSSLGA